MRPTAGQTYAQEIQSLMDGQSQAANQVQQGPITFVTRAVSAISRLLFRPRFFTYSANPPMREQHAGQMPSGLVEFVEFPQWKPPPRLWQMLKRVGTEFTVAVPKVPKVLKVLSPSTRPRGDNVKHMNNMIYIMETTRRLRRNSGVLTISEDQRFEWPSKSCAVSVPKLCQNIFFGDSSVAPVRKGARAEAQTQPKPNQNPTVSPPKWGEGWRSFPLLV